jgi:DUF438 domain-containing protein
MSELLGDKAQGEGAMRLKAVIDKLAAGETPASVKKEFHQLIKGASAEEIASMEQALIDGGLPVEDVQRLCEVHADVFKEGLERQPKAARMPGHPVHTYMAENKEARKRLWPLRLAGIFGSTASITRATDDLKPLIVHYTRKEHQLFPYLERTGFTGPTKVMWGKHDEIRARFKSVDDAVTSGDVQAARREARLLAAQIAMMLFMEERILFPNSLKRLTQTDWAALRKGDDAIGYAWVVPGAMWDAALAAKESTAGGSGAGYSNLEAKIAALTAPDDQSAASLDKAALVRLSEGALTREVLDLVLRNLPLDVSFVDADDKVLYYSDSPHRVFPRSPAIIGRAVQNCHPPKSVSTVEKILEAFKKKEKDKADFWITMGGRFIVISYKAIYDADGTYLGTLESSWDATDIRALEGQRTLLDW